MIAGCRIKDLPIHLLGPESEATALYEQVHGRAVGVEQCLEGRQAHTL